MHLRPIFFRVSLLLVIALHGQAFGATICHTPDRFTPDGQRLPADAVSVCERVRDVLGFFNGVANTEVDAKRSLETLEILAHSVAYLPERSVLFHNQTACRDGPAGKIFCLRDLVEVFEQRQQEITLDLDRRWELFWEALNGRALREESWSQRIRAASAGTWPLLDGVSNALGAMSASLLANVVGNSGREEDSRRHVRQLQEIAGRGSNAVLVAHSQGNLFANLAFDAVKRSHPTAFVQLIHIAPAAATLRGPYVLADIDLVIAALRAASGTSIVYPNLALPFSRVDPSGHGFEATYLDGARPAYQRMLALLNQSLGGIL